jgi:hypothetical protein
MENAMGATEYAVVGAFFANILGSKYQLYAGTYRGRGVGGVVVRFADFAVLFF